MLGVHYDERENRTALIITYKGQEIGRHYDGGEPEDNLFCRDWKWVKEAIESAYILGVSNGKLAGMKRARKMIEGGWEETKEKAKQMGII